MNLDNIKISLNSTIRIKFIEIYDDSIFHNHKERGLTHLRIIIVSNDFINQKITDRHRLIFSKLSDIIKKIYSITLYTYTSKEWDNKKNKKKTNSICFKKR